MKDNHKTEVTFYKAIYDTDDDTEIIAVFYPKLGNSNNYECYAHLGQHSICSESFLARFCRKATEMEYKELFNELENSVGYNLEII